MSVPREPQHGESGRQGKGCFRIPTCESGQGRDECAKKMGNKKAPEIRGLDAILAETEGFEPSIQV